MKFKKIFLTLSASILGATIAFSSGDFAPVAQAATTLPDNHAIEQLDVQFVDGVEGEYGSYLVDVGNRKGTLLIRVDPPKKSWNISWVNWALEKRISAPFYLHTELEKSKQPINVSPIQFEDEKMYYFPSKGTPDEASANYGIKRFGLSKFSGHSNPPTYYIGMAVYLPKKYNSNGVYYFTGNQYALRETGQVKAYFFNDVDVVEEAHARISDGGTFPLMNRVMWGKTELWKGQLGKVTIKKTTTLWKRSDNGDLQKVRDLKVGDEYRVYRFLDEKNGLYGVGSGMFVERSSNEVLYETPSKRNLRLVRIMQGEE